MIDEIDLAAPHLKVNPIQVETLYIRVKDYSFWYGCSQVLFDLNLDIQRRR